MHLHQVACKTRILEVALYQVSRQNCQVGKKEGIAGEDTLIDTGFM